MKKIVVFILVFCVSFSFAQNELKPKIEKKGELIEVTYFYESGIVEQIGTFNSDGTLHGTWKSFDDKGNKLAIGDYKNGRKVGKWFFWTDNSLKEVDYVDSRIIQVNEWKDKTKLAVRNK